MGKKKKQPFTNLKVLEEMYSVRFHRNHASISSSVTVSVLLTCSDLHRESFVTASVGRRIIVLYIDIADTYNSLGGKMGQKK